MAWSNPPISQTRKQRLREITGTRLGPGSAPARPGPGPLSPCTEVLFVLCRRRCRGSLVLTSWMDIVFVSRNAHARGNTRWQSPHSVHSGARRLTAERLLPGQPRGPHVFSKPRRSLQQGRLGPADGLQVHPPSGPSDSRPAGPPPASGCRLSATRRCDARML